MRYGIDFTVKPLSKRGHSHGQKRRVKPSHALASVMDSITTAKPFKNTPKNIQQETLREYWRIHKARERAIKKAEKQNGL